MVEAIVEPISSGQGTICQSDFGIKKKYSVHSITEANQIAELDQ